MTTSQLASARYAAGLVLSLAFNLALVVSLAELGRPLPEDDHEPHRVRPSVVDPPPEDVPDPSPAAAADPSATPLPSSPAAPALDLPSPADVGEGPALEWGSLDDVGLTGAGDLDVAGQAAPVDPPPAAPDEPPQVTVPPDLARFYPQAARRRGIGGRSIVAVDVGPDGRVRRAELLQSEPAGLFDRAAVEAARAFRFIPARKDGRPVPARTRLELNWQPRR